MQDMAYRDARYVQGCKIWHIVRRLLSLAICHKLKRVESRWFYAAGKCFTQNLRTWRVHLSGKLAGIRQLEGMGPTRFIVISVDDYTESRIRCQ